MDKATGYTEHEELVKVNRVFYKLIVEQYGRRWSGPRKLNDGVMSLKYLMNKVKERTV